MPHAEIKFSSDLDLDTQAMLTEIEALILRHDDGAGACKGRAYPTDLFHHSHVNISVSLLVKPHRDRSFSQALLADLDKTLSEMLPGACEFSLGLQYSTEFYVTRRHDIAK